MVKVSKTGGLPFVREFPPLRLAAAPEPCATPLAAVTAPSATPPSTAPSAPTAPVLPPEPRIPELCTTLRTIKIAPNRIVSIVDERRLDTRKLQAAIAAACPTST